MFDAMRIIKYEMNKNTVIKVNLEIYLTKIFVCVCETLICENPPRHLFCHVKH